MGPADPGPMSRPRLEVADIFRAYGPAYRRAHSQHLNLPQLKVMSAIETCRTAALGGHVCCLHQVRPSAHRLQLVPEPALPEVPRQPRHRTGCKRAWRILLPVEYFHVVFTLPSQITDIAYQNKAAVYGLLVPRHRPRRF